MTSSKNVLRTHVQSNGVRETLMPISSALVHILPTIEVEVVNQDTLKVPAKQTNSKCLRRERMRQEWKGSGRLR